MNQTLHHNVMITQSRFAQTITQRSRALGLLPGQPKILECLSYDDGCTQKEIAEYCALDKSTVTTLLNKMQADGLVTRCTSTTDRRQSRIFLTETGKQKAGEMQRVFDCVEHTALNDISAQEADTLLRLLQKVRENLKSL